MNNQYKILQESIIDDNLLDELNNFVKNKKNIKSIKTNSYNFFKYLSSIILKYEKDLKQHYIKTIQKRKNFIKEYINFIKTKNIINKTKYKDIEIAIFFDSRGQLYYPDEEGKQIVNNKYLLNKIYEYFYNRYKDYYDNALVLDEEDISVFKYFIYHLIKIMDMK